jgi:hypothetical protein
MKERRTVSRSARLQSDPRQHGECDAFGMHPRPDDIRSNPEWANPEWANPKRGLPVPACRTAANSTARAGKRRQVAAHSIPRDAISAVPLPMSHPVAMRVRLVFA